MFRSRFVPRLGLLGLLVCAGCPSVPERRVRAPEAPKGWEWVLVEKSRHREHGFPDGVSAVDEDRTGVVVTANSIQFGTPSGGAIPVTLGTIKVDVTGEPGMTMQNIKVYAGSGNLPAAPTGGTLVAEVAAPSPTKHNVTSFSSVPAYDLDDGAYWTWVVVSATKPGGVTLTVNASLELTLIEDVFGAAFYEY